MKARACLSLLLATLVVSVPSRAQDARELEERAVSADREAREKRQAADEALEGAADARRRMQALAADAQRFERQATRLENRLAMLSRQRSALLTDVAAEQKGLTHLLAAVQRMARRPVAAALLAPADAVETARTAALADTLRPRIAQRTADLRARLSKLASLTAEVRGQRALLEGSRRDLAEAVAELDTLASGYREESEALGAEAVAARRRARSLAAEAVERGGLTPSVTLPERVRRARAIRSFRPGPAEIARTGYRAPVAGRVTLPFGEVNTVGVTERGVTVKTRPGAVVTAPADGTVIFAGPFREEEGVVILEHERGMTSILSGLSRMAVAEGQPVTRGLPLGRVDTDAALYVELRRRGRPVDPMLYMQKRQHAAETGRGGGE
ncbi:murein hydrolase activator EnvC family protein [Pacificimonas flava]|uniref:murein hydrolase activator EnvC family protein n=1 Tax=Pacificimonas flava TaxID=1234595 RepID=UPI00122E18FE|nr:peptidoglycan DD-metalloendopeptidase family protein [Pacificimonas flava]MBB5279309.1 septal ring factor EnvC (AmiA/AmiB activator) [Pacificimonas flava]